jgi:hypothetical protein
MEGSTKAGEREDGKAGSGPAERDWADWRNSAARDRIVWVRVAGPFLLLHRNLSIRIIAEP